MTNAAMMPAITTPTVVAIAEDRRSRSTLPQNRGAVSTVAQFCERPRVGQPGRVGVEVGGRAEAADEDVEHRPDRDRGDDERDEVDERLSPVEAAAGARVSRRRRRCSAIALDRWSTFSSPLE